MPRRSDIHSILIIGSGPIVIGQGCEFDYSGVQACRALKEEGYRIVLINSNPATIMTDPEFADATYIEPITPEAVEKILAREKAQGTPIDALLPTLGGQTGLNTGMNCFDQGILEKYGVQMIGANREAIFRGEDRQRFKELMAEIGLKTPISGVVHNMPDAREVLKIVGLPAIIRPAFTLGGTGGGIAYNIEEYEEIVQRGLDASPVTEVLIEQSVIGWKEYEMEVVRDKNDNCIIICSIENIDAMGVHTGDSITVAPIQTLSDKEFQKMRDASFAVIRAVGVETGGSNIQFGINPKNGDMVVIEMNPRVSRSSALASKATGYPIAKIAAKLAVGYTLDELPNPITSRKRPVTSNGNSPAEKGKSVVAPMKSVEAPGKSVEAPGKSVEAPGKSVEASGKSAEAPGKSVEVPGKSAEAPGKSVEAPGKSVEASGKPEFASGNVREDYELYTSACFEPSIDYCVIKIPRWTFEKFPDADETLTTQMKSVGEAMAIGRTFKEALQKGIRSMEVKRFGFGLDKSDSSLNPETWPIPEDTLRRKLSVPSQGRLYYVRYALKMNWTIEQIYSLTNIDPWFLAQMKELVDFEKKIFGLKFAHDVLADLEAADDRLAEQVVELIREAKPLGYSDIQLAAAFNVQPWRVTKLRKESGIEPIYKLVDTCAAEFEASTPYYYSSYETVFKTYDPNRKVAEVKNKKATPFDAQFAEASKWSEVTEDEIRLTNKQKVIIIGGGPNRIGQGIEFDYCCVHAAFAMKELGYESVMINSNPETVSTDYDTSDLLFFEPLTHEDVLNICERLNGVPFRTPGTSKIHLTAESKDLIQQKHIAAIEKQLNDRGIGEVVLIGSAGAGTKDREVASIYYTLMDAQGRQFEAAFNMANPNSVLDFYSGTKFGISESKLKETAGYVSNLLKGGLVKGVIVQLGGQTPLNLARGLHDAGVPIIGTSIDMLEAAGDREKFRSLVEEVGLKQPENGIARSVDDARKIAAQIGYPVLVRPSFVLGGRAMEIVSDEDQLNHYMAIAVKQEGDNPILIDKFLDHATECDVDCIADYDAAGKGRSVICGVMEHIEEAGIHSGDSACALPPYSFSKELIGRLKDNTHKLAKALKVRGLMNVQYAIKDNEIYLIEVNPRASRTIPFVGKATGLPWASYAAKVMAGKSLDELGVKEQPDPKHVSVKEVVFPFSKFPGVDVILGPEMRSTGEVMGIDKDFASAFAKSQIAAGASLPIKGSVYISVNAQDKSEIVEIARQYEKCAFKIVATGGTFDVLTKAGVKCERINKLAEGRPNIRDAIKNGQVQLIINTPTKKGPATDEGKIRAMAVMNKVPILTTLTAAKAAGLAIAQLQQHGWSVQPLQKYHAK